MPSITLPVILDEPTQQSRYVHGTIERAGIGVSYVPLLSVLGGGPTSIDCISVLTDEQLIWQLRQGGELMQSDWQPPDGNPTPGPLVDADAVGIMGGQIVAAGLCAKTTNAGASTEIVRGFDVELMEGEPLTLCVRRLSGTGGIVSAVMTWSTVNAA